MCSKRNKTLITAGIITLVQTFIQGVFSLICLGQYYCVVDFLRTYPLLVYLRILYFHNPELCLTQINIGNAIPELPNQAFVSVPNIPFTVKRTFIINWFSFSLCLLWLVSSMLLLGSPRRRIILVPWVITTVAMCSLDIVACVSYANDSFHTKTLNDMLKYIGARASGVGNVVLDTSWASWIMVIVYTRFVIFFIINVLILIVVLVDMSTMRRNRATPLGNERRPDHRRQTFYRNENEVSPSSHQKRTLPRARDSVRALHPALFSSEVRLQSALRRLAPLPTNIDKKHTVSFPENLKSIPQRLENLMTEQYRRFNQDIDLVCPVSTFQSMPQLPFTNDEHSKTSEELRDSITRQGRRRSTLAELQSQMPWAYQPSPYRVPDQLPSDEDRPPVPLADYTLASNARKASAVHRAGSSLSMMAQKRDETKQHPRRKSPLTQSDVLY